jgi:penicillin V acylase-like amidase (Ntn superfamily)
LTEPTTPAADQRASLNELQWIQYQLDNSSTIDEVIGSDQLIRISRNDAAPLHYLVADSKGHAATIEFIKGKMVVHKSNESGYPGADQYCLLGVIACIQGQIKTILPALR